VNSTDALQLVVVSQRTLFNPKRAEIFDALEQNLSSWLASAGYFPCSIPNGAVDKKLLKEFLVRVSPVGVVLSGGNDIGECKQRDALEFALIELCLDLSIPIFGICRGMQIVGNYFDVKLIKVSNHVGIHRISGEHSRNVNSFHNYALASCPIGFEITSIAEDGVIEGIRSTKYRINCCMWHPEREKRWDSLDIQELRNFFD